MFFPQNPAPPRLAMPSRHAVAPSGPASPRPKSHPATRAALLRRSRHGASDPPVSSETSHGFPPVPVLSGNEGNSVRAEEEDGRTNEDAGASSCRSLAPSGFRRRPPRKTRASEQRRRWAAPPPPGRLHGVLSRMHHHKSTTQRHRFIRCGVKLKEEELPQLTDM
jgi:hypothetical protein